MEGHRSRYPSSEDVPSQVDQWRAAFDAVSSIPHSECSAETGTQRAPRGHVISPPETGDDEAASALLVVVNAGLGAL